MDLGWFGDDLGTVRTDLGPILKSRKFESSEWKIKCKGPQIDLKWSIFDGFSVYGNWPFWQFCSKPNRETYAKQNSSRNGQRNEPSTSRYRRSARNFATILTVPTALRITDLKNSNFSWSEPEIINIIKRIVINGPTPYHSTTATTTTHYYYYYY